MNPKIVVIKNSKDDGHKARQGVNRYQKKMMGRKKAQSTLEFSLLVTIILAALMVMGIYFKRGLQGRWKSSVDEVGEQYDPKATNSGIVYTLEASVETRLTTTPSGDGYWTTRVDQTNSVERRTGMSRVATSP